MKIGVFYHSKKGDAAPRRFVAVYWIYWSDSAAHIRFGSRLICPRHLENKTERCDFCWPLLPAISDRRTSKTEYSEVRIFFFIFSSTQLLIRQLWDDLKVGLLENEQILIHVSENINAEQLLPWPLKVADQLVEFSNRLFFKRFFFSHSGTCFLKVLQLILFLDHVFNLVDYLLSISAPCSSSTWLYR